MNEKAIHRTRKKRRAVLAGSFTIEAALLIPLLLSVIFMILQLTLYLHDMVWTEAWIGWQAWQMFVEAEGGSAESGTEDEEGFPVPALPVLRFAGSETGRTSGVAEDRVWIAASFDVNTVAGFGALIFEGQPSSVQKQAQERVTDTPGFMRLAGAILEGDE